MVKIDTSRADYLKAIYSCMEKEGSASNKRITDLLEVSPSSVTEMIRRLVEAGDVYLDKKEIYLTEQGMVEVKEILTKHRLWEIFLVRYLNYSWYEVHEEADALEHATSDRLKDRLNELLNHPEHCPHGSEIFENHKHKDKLRLLSDLKPGDETSVHRVADDKELLEYLEKKHICIDKKIMVLGIDEYDGSMTVWCDEEEVVLAKKATTKIMVL